MAPSRARPPPTSSATGAGADDAHSETTATTSSSHPNHHTHSNHHGPTSHPSTNQHLTSVTKTSSTSNTARSKKPNHHHPVSTSNTSTSALKDRDKDVPSSTQPHSYSHPLSSSTLPGAGLFPDSSGVGGARNTAGGAGTKELGGAGGNSGIPWPSLPLSSLRAYRHQHGVQTANCFSSHQNYLLLNSGEGLGAYSPTMAGGRGRNKGVTDEGGKTSGSLVGKDGGKDEGRDGEGRNGGRDGGKEGLRGNGVRKKTKHNDSSNNSPHHRVPRPELERVLRRESNARGVGEVDVLASLLLLSSSGGGGSGGVEGRR